VYWKDVLRRFYGNFSAELAQAEKDLDGTRIKIPAEETDEICEVCGKKLVIKTGRFGRFLACPGWPECTFSKPLVVEANGRCPKCGGRILKKTSKKGYTYYGCEYNRTVNGSPCDFMTWDIPQKDNCPVCGKTLFKVSGKGQKKVFCINESCPQFLPEDQRGYRRRKAESTGVSEAAAAALVDPATGELLEPTPAPETAPKKTTKRSSAAKSAPKKTTKRSTAQKTAAKAAPKADKPKRVLTEAQKEALARGRAKAKANREAANKQKSED
jgi:DNA topoisomerase-1